MSGASPRSPMDIALSLLARRGYSAKELAARLVRGGMLPEAAEKVTAECRRLNLVNDEVYAQDCAEMLAARNLGARRIRQELVRRGVAEFAADAVEAQRENEAERAVEAARYKLRLIPPADPPVKKRQKLYRFLFARGFDPETVRQAADAALGGAGEDADGL